MDAGSGNNGEACLSMLQTFLKAGITLKNI